jgi:hypothetical protein
MATHFWHIVREPFKVDGDLVAHLVDLTGGGAVYV